LHESPTPAGKMRHLRNVWWGILFGCIYWLLVSLGRIGYEHLCATTTLDVFDGTVGRKAVEVKYANAVFAEIKAEKASLEMGSGSVEEQPLREDAVGLYGEISPSRAEIEKYIRAVFGEDGEGWALCVVDCESDFRPLVVSPNGLYFGLFQFESATYFSSGGTDLADWGEQVRTAHKLYLRGEIWRWPVCSRRC